MLVDKITTGFVIQTFDTETGKYVSQSFVAGDQTDYEQDGEPVDLAECGTLDVTYLPYEMIQPDDNGNIEPSATSPAYQQVINDIADTLEPELDNVDCLETLETLVSGQLCLVLETMKTEVVETLMKRKPSLTAS